jgi:hypothetical protein
VHISDLEIPFLCDSQKSQEQFAVFFAPLGTTFDHIKNVFKHKKEQKREQKT